MQMQDLKLIAAKLSSFKPHFVSYRVIMGDQKSMFPIDSSRDIARNQLSGARALKKTVTLSRARHIQQFLKPGF